MPYFIFFKDGKVVGTLGDTNPSELDIKFPSFLDP
jgi:hypothetical protein